MTLKVEADECTPYEMPLSKAEGLCTQLDRLGVKKIPMASFQLAVN